MSYKIEVFVSYGNKKESMGKFLFPKADQYIVWTVNLETEIRALFRKYNIDPDSAEVRMEVEYIQKETEVKIYRIDEVVNKVEDMILSLTLAA